MKRGLDAALRLALSVASPLALWWAVVLIWRPDVFILPGPDRVALAFVLRWRELLTNGATTAMEIVLGFVVGCLVGIGLALLMVIVPRFGRVVTPIVVVSQSLPVFAIAPLLVVWFGFGLASKIVMATIVIFFPVASSLHDGLTRTDPGLLDLARLHGAGRWDELALIRWPAALPSLVSGLRMAATVAPFGAIVGEWVGASSGLGLVLLQANARSQIDFMLAALCVVVALALLLRFAVEEMTRGLAPWAAESAR